MLTFGTTLANGASSQPDLKALLAGMDRASRLYLDAALRFTCDETITQSIPRGIHVGRYQYIFVYDAREGFKDYRMRAGRGERPAVDPAREGFRILQRSYFWVLVFQGKRQAYHRYAILGEASWGGASVLLLRFEPIPPYREGINDWFGTAWVDPSSFQILKVEATRADQKDAWDWVLRDPKAEEAHAWTGSDKSFTLQKVSTEFKSLKNGMRFPSRSRIVQTRYELAHAGQEASRVSEEDTVQTYRHYEFYGVRSAEEIRSLLSVHGGKRR
ncbi:MAG TPA: hypothetical protein VGR38_08740 [Candidatus Polarisedimenticolia bacterium]|nr:hypothetical protein [Candidatus Polarisedimenticolia bacterium]